MLPSCLELSTKVVEAGCNATCRTSSLEVLDFLQGKQEMKRRVLEVNVGEQVLLRSSQTC